MEFSCKLSTKYREMGKRSNILIKMVINLNKNKIVIE
jgi:hypothetical protein